MEPVSEQPFIGGHPSGSIRLLKNSSGEEAAYRFEHRVTVCGVRVSRHTKTFSADDYNRSRERTLAAAEAHQRSYCEQNGLMHNAYRCRDGVVEMRLRRRSINGKLDEYCYFDESDLSTVEKYIWFKHNFQVEANVHGKRVSMGRFLLQQRRVVHINGNPLDCRRCNLACTLHSRTSITWQECRSRALVRWTVDGKRKAQTFSVHR